MQKIRTGLRRRNLPYEIAIEQLDKIEDPDAIPAMEAILSLDSRQTALKVIDKLTAMQVTPATRSLARHAVFSPWLDVRQRAASSLQDRNADGYVPLMLGAMYQPISSRTFAVRTRGGMAFRHNLILEGQNNRQQVFIDSTLPSELMQQEVHQQNLNTKLLNQRIADALNIATDQKLSDSPQEWWQWWNLQNEIYVEGQKPIRSSSNNGQLARIKRNLDFQQAESNRQAAIRAQIARDAQMFPMSALLSGSSIGGCDCLAAGTIVWTSRGPMAVEKLQVGDMLLSQHTETGELTYKPVLRPTIRPASVLIQIHIGNEIIQASGGHPFWVAGEGWIKARQLRSGMILHGLTGPLRIGLVEDGKKQKSYNVILDDFHTYFVGESQLLSHDNTVRQPTDAIVPGLLER